MTGILPVNVSFPAFGPSIFLVSELTSENQFPCGRVFRFQRDKKARCAMKNQILALLLCWTLVVPFAAAEKSPRCRCRIQATSL